jgi:hypothetical protein
MWSVNSVTYLSGNTSDMTGFGKKFGFIEAGKDIGWIAMIEEILIFLSWVLPGHDELQD